MKNNKNYEHYIYFKLFGWRRITPTREFKISRYKDLSILIAILVAIAFIGGYSEKLHKEILELSPSSSYVNAPKSIDIAGSPQTSPKENITNILEVKDTDTLGEVSVLSAYGQYTKSLQEDPKDWENYFKQISVCPHNNPGNLVYAKQPNAIKVGRWASFPDIQTGFRALIKQIELDNSRNHTVASFIHKYAPPHENNTTLYVNQIAEWTASSTQTKIKDIDAVLLARAIVKKECNY